MAVIKDLKRKRPEDEDMKKNKKKLVITTQAVFIEEDEEDIKNSNCSLCISSSIHSNWLLGRRTIYSSNTTCDALFEIDSGSRNLQGALGIIYTDYVRSRIYFERFISLAERLQDTNTFHEFFQETGIYYNCSTFLRNTLKLLCNWLVQLHNQGIHFELNQHNLVFSLKKESVYPCLLELVNNSSQRRPPNRRSMFLLLETLLRVLAVKCSDMPLNLQRHPDIESLFICLRNFPSNDLTTHPCLKSLEERALFLRECHNSAFSNENLVLDSTIFRDNVSRDSWVLVVQQESPHLGETIQYQISHKQGNPYTDDPKELLRFIRNVQEHPPSYNGQVYDVRNLVSDLDRIFPSLLWYLRRYFV